jgi:hypothetical protein
MSNFQSLCTSRLESNLPPLSIRRYFNYTQSWRSLLSFSTVGFTIPCLDLKESRIIFLMDMTPSIARNTLHLWYFVLPRNCNPGTVGMPSRLKWILLYPSVDFFSDSPCRSHIFAWGHGALLLFHPRVFAVQRGNITQSLV